MSLFIGQPSVLDLPNPEQGLDNEAPATNVELIKSAFRDAEAIESSDSKYNMLAEQWATVIEDIKESDGAVFGNPARGFRDYDRATATIFQYIADHPDTLGHMAGLNEDQIQQTAKLSAQAIREENIAIQSTRPESFIPEIIGGMGSALTDPYVAASIPFGFLGRISSVWNLMAREAAIGATSEAFVQYDVSKWYKELGYDYGIKDFASRVAIAGTGAAILSGGIYTAAKGINLTAIQAKKGYEAFVKAGGKRNPEAERYVSNLEDDLNSNPFKNDEDGFIHEKKLNEAIDFIEGEFYEVTSKALPELPAPVKTSNPVEAAPINSDRPNLSGQLFEYKPNEINVDAKTFQFKSGGDSDGVTKRLSSVEKWDPELAGEIMVYEYADGRTFIADGHQRLALAKRLESKNLDSDVKLIARVYRERDGITPGQARLRAAVKNIAQDSGTALDAARVFREKEGVNIDFATLPISSRLVSDGLDIMKLSDDAFMAVVNEVVPHNYAAVVGRILQDKPELHVAAVDVLAKTNPSNVFQAEAIIRQMDSAPTMTATQNDLFGEEIITTSLYKERAKILDAAFKRLQKDKAAFNTLINNAEKIELEGNTLARDKNIERRDADAQAIQVLQALANSKGPISNALNAAARQAAETGKYENPIADFVDAIRGGIDSGDIRGAATSRNRSDLDDLSTQREIKERENDRLDDFDEPGSSGFEKQADQLEQDMFGGMGRVEDEAPTLSGEGAQPEVARSKPESEDVDAELEGIDMDTEVPVGVRFDEDTGEFVPEVLTVRQIKESIEQDKSMLDYVGSCVK